MIITIIIINDHLFFKSLDPVWWVGTDYPCLSYPSLLIITIGFKLNTVLTHIE